MKRSLVFGDLSAPCGTKRSGYIRIPGESQELPLTIVNGREDGKLFLITASIHGFEYPGIEASIEFSEELDPEEVCGAIVILPIINSSAFYGRRPVVCPDDEQEKNLNRLAPGSRAGTYGDRLIAFLLDEFVSRADFHIDLHSGDATEKLVNFAAAGNSPDPSVSALVQDVIHHTSYQYYIRSAGKTEFYNGSAIYKGVPSMMFEVGGSGTWTREQVDEEKSNLRRIAQCLGILPGKPELNRNQVWLKRQSWVDCEEAGLFYASVNVGDHVSKGQKLFEIRDVFGRLLSEYSAQYDGKVMILNTTLGVSRGSLAAFYGAQAD